MIKNEIISSIKKVEKIYDTGEKPILVTCSDLNHYICKYKRSSKPALKLACELIGNVLAKNASFATPPFNLIRIKKEHWPTGILRNSEETLALGSLFQENVIDVTGSSISHIKQGCDELKQILRIGIFDLWVANEDRNSNNSNLLYNLSNGQLISMDYGCIFNNATFDYPLMNLSFNESILYSYLFRHIIKKYKRSEILKIAENIFKEFEKMVYDKKKLNVEEILPNEWDVDTELVKLKLKEIYSNKWLESLKEEYNEILITVLKEQYE